MNYYPRGSRMDGALNNSTESQEGTMSTELEVVQQQPLSAGDVRAQVNLIQEVMQSVMKDGTHFGKVPGAGDKPTLFKAGAEKLAATFRLAIDPIAEELSYGDEFRVRVVARITEMGSGRFLGAGVGEASSAESKYQWRAAVCAEEFDAAPENQRRVKWNKAYPPKPAWSQKQVRMNVADVANTVLKMAKKRAMVDGILTVTGASDIFTQDIEELPREYLDQKAAPASVTQAPPQTRSHEPDHASQEPGMYDQPPAPSSGEPDIRPRSQKGAQPTTQPSPEPQGQPQEQHEDPQGEVVGAEPVITDKQRKMFFAISRSANLTDDQVKGALAQVGIHCHRASIPKSRFQDALRAIDPTFKFHQDKPAN